MTVLLSPLWILLHLNISVFWSLSPEQCRVSWVAEWKCRVLGSPCFWIDSGVGL
jgi:hypothetical protein